MKHKEIAGKVRYMDLATGFWCLVDNRYRKWRILQPPAALQKEGLKIKATVEVVEEGASIFMSGTPIKILSFEVIA